MCISDSANLCENGDSRGTTYGHYFVVHGQRSTNILSLSDARISVLSSSTVVDSVLPSHEHCYSTPIALNETPSQSYMMSYGITQCYVPPDTSEHTPT